MGLPCRSRISRAVFCTFDGAAARGARILSEKYGSTCKYPSMLFTFLSAFADKLTSVIHLMPCPQKIELFFADCGKKQDRLRQEGKYGKME